MFRIRNLASHLLLMAVVLGIQSCGQESPGFDSSNPGSGNIDNGNNGGSSNANIIAGKNIYQNQCLICHGANGEGGTATRLDKVTDKCTSCKSYSALVEATLQTMPPNNPGSCGQACSEQVGEFIWVTFLGNDPVTSGNDNGGDDNNNGGNDDNTGGDDDSNDNDDAAGNIAVGEDLYNKNCAGCHHAKKPDATKSKYSLNGKDYDSLLKYIEAEMAPISVDCKGTCARDITAYMKSWGDSSNDDNIDYGSCNGVSYGPRTISVLTKTEFANSIEDLTGINVKSDLGLSSYDSIPADNLLDGFSNNTMAAVSTGSLISYDLVVNKVVSKLAETDFKSVFDCSAHADDTACATAFVEQYMTKVFRRPLKDAEKAQYQKMFTTDYTGGDMNEGFKLALRTMFTSPQFLYRDETGVSIADIKSGKTGDSNDEVPIVVLVDSKEPLDLAGYAYEGFDNKTLTGKEVIQFVARSTGDNAAPVLKIVLGSESKEVTIDSTTGKSYSIETGGFSGNGLHIGLQITTSGSIQVESFKFVPTDFKEPEVELDDNAYMLTAYQLAAYLAYTFTGTTPDDALLTAAGNGELETKEQIEAQVERLLKTDRAYERFGNFAAQWLRTDGVLTIAKSDKVYPTFTTEVRQAMAQEVRDLFNHVVLDQKEPFTTLYNGRYTFANKALADFYGIGGVSGSEMQKVTTTDRAGIVTLGAFMTFHAHEEDTGPILRATYLRRRMMCHHVPEPPTGVALADDGSEVNFDEEREAAQQKLNEYLEAHGGIATTRMKYETRTSATACKSCHAEMINPLGGGMEDFDAVGLLQTKDFNGLDVDFNGELIGVTSTSDGQKYSFSGSVQLADYIANLEGTRKCFVENSFRMAMGTGSSYLDRLYEVGLSKAEQHYYSCQVDKLDQKFVDSKESPIELLKALGSMDSVRYRKDVAR